ncbi:MAG: Type IV pilus assembly protein PilC, partial [Microgenomates group bacterium GW2011_GWC1_39_7]
MAKFQYTARTKEGKLESDIAEASSLEAAISMLQNQQLVIIEIKPFIEAEYLNLNILTKQIASLINRIKSEDIVLFSKQLSILIQAKVPLVQSLRVLTKQTRNPNFAGIINAVANDVDAGMIFSRALSKYPKVFSNFFIQMTRSGEISGRLEETLTYLSDYINKQYLLNSKARGAMIYPAFI